MNKPHKNLDAWKKGMTLVEEVYRLTSSYPRHEQYGLVDQMRRSAVSIPANIAEGAARQTKREFAQFLHIARGSLSELDTYVDLSSRLAYATLDSSSRIPQLLEDIDRMLSGLIRRSSAISRLPSPVSHTHD